MGRDKREIRGCYIIQIAGDSSLIDTLVSRPRWKYDFWNFSGIFHMYMSKSGEIWTLDPSIWWNPGKVGLQLAKKIWVNLVSSGWYILVGFWGSLDHSFHPKLAGYQRTPKYRWRTQMPIWTLWAEKMGISQMPSRQNHAVLMGHPGGQSGQKGKS